MSQEEFETVIGLEVHVQLNTKTKIFCNCSTDYSNKPANTHVCEVCMGLPGVLPVLNQNVLQYAMKACMALECDITKETKFDRKHYFYPDLPKAYQISQFDKPIGERGRIRIELEDGSERLIGVTRIHMEEDAGKSLHAENGETLVDYNRACVPLLEIVSEPDMRTPEEARAYLEKLKLIMRYIGVSDCDMENGSLRCDVNVSVRPVGTEKFGTKVEIKNMNSFRSVVRALEYEKKRQVRQIKRDQRILQQTMLWDDVKGETRVMRTKENADDYRYFPEPDLPPVHITQDMIQEVSQLLPELPDKKVDRIIKTYQIPAYNARLMAEDRELSDYFEEAVRSHNNPVSISNWILSELLRELNKDLLPIRDCKIKASHLGKLVYLIDSGVISGKIAKDVFEEMYKEGSEPESIVKSRGLTQISDDSQIQEIILAVLTNNSQSVHDMQAGKMKAFGFLVGQIMKETRGKANPGKVNEILKSLLREKYQIECP
ncbi:MAG: Asp-tRNA(Asn)/Glu-tRNA(Gln) amidotransferase subunit GatB [Candidatus Cloacimonetes bacterium]|nr:Asp-tRNA(Asn)/Glu-tRNA(Gln) amidotransferase subunit GatB [Candidatus Cloacimonadota bacterium]